MILVQNFAIIISENMEDMNFQSTRRWDSMGKADISDFVEYLQIEKTASSYTIKYYRNDLAAFEDFLEQEGVDKPSDIDYQMVRLFSKRFYEQKLSRRSVSRKISRLRTYFKFLKREGKVLSNPFNLVMLPNQEKVIPGFLYME